MKKRYPGQTKMKRLGKKANAASKRCNRKAAEHYLQLKKCNAQVPYAYVVGIHNAGSGVEMG